MKRLLAVLLVLGSVFAASSSYAFCTYTNARGMTFTGPTAGIAQSNCYAVSRYCYFQGCTAIQCTVYGPNGGQWTASGINRGAAMNNAMNTCYANKPNPGPCTPGPCHPM